MQKLLEGSLPGIVAQPNDMAELMIDRLGKVGCKTALRLAERAFGSAGFPTGSNAGKLQLQALTEILDDLAGDQLTAGELCNIM